MTEQRKQLEQIRENVKEHTPGPWKVVGPFFGNYSVRGEGNQHVCSVPARRTQDFPHANALLIAEAPDLLRIAIDAEAEIARARDDGSREERELIYALIEQELGALAAFKIIERRQKEQQ